MKKFLKFLPMLLIAVVGSMLFLSCDDKDEVISSDQLPSQAKDFIEQYYPSAEIISTEKDNDEYEVYLNDGTRIDFNKSGEWKDVNAAIGAVIPSGFYPSAIDSYVNANYPANGINEISKERNGFDVELLTGIELKFDLDGSFVGYDR